MEKETQYLLRLLGAFLQETEPEAAQVDWTVLYRLSQIHSVPGILGYMTMLHPVCPDEQLRQRLRTICMNTIARFSRRAALAEVLCGELAQKGIDVMTMKGLVVRGCYPIPELRTFGDVDLVIRPQDRQACHRWMLEQGFAVKTDWEPVYSYTRDDEFYEIHTQLLEVDVSDKADHRAYFRQGWEHAAQTAPHRWQMTPEFHFLYMLTHIAKHVTGAGAGLRMYLDVAAFLRHSGGQLDWAVITRELDTLRLRRFADTVLTAVEAWFGVTAPTDWTRTEETLLAEFTDFTVSGGVFGRIGRDSGTVTLKSQAGEGVSRTDTVLRRLFPAAETIQSRYTYLQHKPWLLPVAWVHRVFRTRDTWKAHAREAKNILSADEEQVRRLRQLCGKIGL